MHVRNLIVFFMIDKNLKIMSQKYLLNTLTKTFKGLKKERKKD